MNNRKFMRRLIRRAGMWLFIGAVLSWMTAAIPAFLSEMDWLALKGPADLIWPPGLFKQMKKEIQNRPEFADATAEEIDAAFMDALEALASHPSGSTWTAVGLEDPRMIVVGGEGRWWWNKWAEGLLAEPIGRPRGKVCIFPGGMPSAPPERMLSDASVRSPDAPWHWWACNRRQRHGFAHWIEVGHVVGFVPDGSPMPPYGTPQNEVYRWAVDCYCGSIPTEVHRHEFPSWSVFSHCQERSWEDHVVVQNLWGWPFACMYSQLWAKPARPRAPGGGGYVPLPRFGADDPMFRTNAILMRTDYTGDDTTHLPTGVIPIPFIANTLTYACGLWLALSGVRLGVKASRRRRGRCQGCGHRQDPGGAQPVCPECGRGY